MNLPSSQRGGRSPLASWAARAPCSRQVCRACGRPSELQRVLPARCPQQRRHGGVQRTSSGATTTLLDMQAIVCCDWHHGASDHHRRTTARRIGPRLRSWSCATSCALGHPSGHLSPAGGECTRPCLARDSPRLARCSAGQPAPPAANRGKTSKCNADAKGSSSPSQPTWMTEGVTMASGAREEGQTDSPKWLPPQRCNRRAVSADPGRFGPNSACIPGCRPPMSPPTANEPPSASPFVQRRSRPPSRDPD